MEAEDIVISGISCRLPQSDNMEEFWENLINGVDMVTTDNQRYDTSKFAIWILIQIEPPFFKSFTIKSLNHSQTNAAHSWYLFDVQRVIYK